MQLELVTCNYTPEVITSIILLIQYLLILFVLTWVITKAAAVRNSNKEEYFYHFMCVGTCLLRIATFSYSALFHSYTTTFFIILLLSPLPFLTAITVLIAIWVRLYIMKCYDHRKIHWAALNSNYLLLGLNIGIYASGIILSVLITLSKFDCKKHLGNFMIGLECCFEFITTFALVVAGRALLNKIKEIVNTYPLRLLSWTLLVFIISFCRATSMILQIIGIFRNVTENSIESSIYYVLALNCFEILPMVVFLKAVVISAEYLENDKGENCFDSSSSSVFNSVFISEQE